MISVRLRAAGGVIGPVAFVGAWSLTGLSARNYSANHDAISRLAETGAPTRAAMTAGFVAFGIAVPVYASTLRCTLDGWAWATAVATGIATLGVAAVPLGSPTRDTVHGCFATAGYLTLAATPLLASRAFTRAGRSAWARASLLSGIASGAFLIATIPAAAHGLFQRLGLGAVDVWIVATAIEIMRTGRLTGRTSPGRTSPGRKLSPFLHLRFHRVRTGGMSGETPPSPLPRPLSVTMGR